MLRSSPQVVARWIVLLAVATALGLLVSACTSSESPNAGGNTDDNRIDDPAAIAVVAAIERFDGTSADVGPFEVIVVAADVDLDALRDLLPVARIVETRPDAEPYYVVVEVRQDGALWAVVLESHDAAFFRGELFFEIVDGVAEPRTAEDAGVTVTTTVS